MSCLFQQKILSKLTLKQFYV